ncbi:MAG: triose-phosphate isomerase [Negativicutes bacterium]|nr:triose-phosphate isomerase [Negativicutes bacterium]
MKRFIIGSGWKMNNTVAKSVELLEELKAEVAGFDAFPLFVLPSFTALSAVGDWIGQETWIRFGAQNMHWQDSGAYTGEISASMLKELGCTYVELNHQERRTYFNETNQTTNLKIHTALKHSLTPILCLGEEEILPGTATQRFLQEQMREMLVGIQPAAIANIVFAYEPRWAIGKAEAAPASHVKTVHGIIRDVLAEQYGPTVAAKTDIIYGGSVDKSNAVEIAVQDGVDGLFIGRAGLRGKTFAAIIKDVAVALKAKQQ